METNKENFEHHLVLFKRIKNIVMFERSNSETFKILTEKTTLYFWNFLRDRDFLVKDEIWVVASYYLTIWISGKIDNLYVLVAKSRNTSV